MLQDNTNPSNLNDYLIQKKIEIMMDINNKKINNELKKISDMINGLNEEICEIKKHFNEGTGIQKNPTTTFDTREKSNCDNLNIPKNKGDKPKPRYGDYSSEDVNIDKFFYFGNKK